MIVYSFVSCFVSYFAFVNFNETLMTVATLWRWGEQESKKLWCDHNVKSSCRSWQRKYTCFDCGLTISMRLQVMVLPGGIQQGGSRAVGGGVWEYQVEFWLDFTLKAWCSTVSGILPVGCRQMRRHRTAPVDSMGCERAHDEDAEPQVRRLTQLSHLLCSLFWY